MSWLIAVTSGAPIFWPPLTMGGRCVPAGTLFAGASLTARDLLHDAPGIR